MTPLCTPFAGAPEQRGVASARGHEMPPALASIKTVKRLVTLEAQLTMQRTHVLTGPVMRALVFQWWIRRPDARVSWRSHDGSPKSLSGRAPQRAVLLVNQDSELL